MSYSELTESAFNQMAERAREALSRNSLAATGLAPSLYDMVHALVLKREIRDQYALLGFQVPKSINADIEAFTRKVKLKYKEELEEKLAAAKRKAEELKSKERQREEAEKEIADLEVELGR